MAGSNGRAKRHFFGGTGLYIALFLGVTALAVAGYWTLLPKNTTDKDAENVSSQVELPVQDETPQMPEAELPQEAAKPAEPVEEPPEDLTVMDEATGVEDTVPAMESETDAQPVAPRLVVAPLVGEEVAAFSVDELTYNETLGDWRTHDGIDIAAEVGQIVCHLVERLDDSLQQLALRLGFIEGETLQQTLQICGLFGNRHGCILQYSVFIRQKPTFSNRIEQKVP